MLTPEQIKQYQNKYNLTSVKAPTPAKSAYMRMSERGADWSANTISSAFKGGVEQSKQGYETAKNAKNVGELMGGSLNFLGGAIGATFSPLAPAFRPITKSVEYAGDKIGDIEAVQKFSQTPTGEATSAGTEAVANLANIAGTVAGVKAGGPKVQEMASNLKTGVVDTATNVAGKVRPTIAGTGRVLKQAGESSYAVTAPTSEGTARALQTYKESTPNLATRIKNTVTGETQGKPTTEANTAARYGLMGTEKEIGVQAGRFMDKVWTETVQPALRNANGKLDMNKFWSELEKKIRVENPELNRRNALLEGLEDVKSGYGKVSRVGLEKLQEYKEGWTKFLSEQVWKGKPIASSTKEVMSLAGDIARDFIYKNTPPEVRQAYIDYGNLKSIREAGIKSGVGDLAKKSISRGAWQFVMDKAVTPVATTMGKILYRTGEGLEFIGDTGAKTVGDIIGKETPPNLTGGGIPKTMNTKLPTTETNLISEARKYKSAEEFVKAQGEKTFTVNSDELISKGAKNQMIKEYSKDSVAFAEKQIKAGKSEPVMVSFKDGKYRLEDGEHRLEAYGNLGIKEIPVQIKGDRATSQLTDIWKKANEKR